MLGALSERGRLFMGVYALESPKRIPAPWKGKQRESSLPLDTPSPVIPHEAPDRLVKLEPPNKRVRVTKEVTRRPPALSCHHCRKTRTAPGLRMRLMVCCVNCEVWWHVDCINNRHADFSDEPASTSLPLPLCPACQNICSCPRCLNVPPKPRNGRRNLTSGNRSHRKKVPLVVPDQEVEVEERAFESAVLLGERIREERKKGRQRYWERFLDSPSTSSLLDDDGEEDEMEVERVMKAREGSYSSVDSTDEDSEEDGEEYWRGSGGSVSSAETSFVDGASWIGEEGKRRDSRGSFYGSASPALEEAAAEESSPEESIEIIPLPNSPTPTFALPIPDPIPSTTNRTIKEIELGLDSFSDEQLGSAIRAMLLAGPSFFGLSPFSSTIMDGGRYANGREGGKECEMKWFRKSVELSFMSTLAPPPPTESITLQESDDITLHARPLTVHEANLTRSSISATLLEGDETTLLECDETAGAGEEGEAGVYDSWTEGWLAIA